MASDSSDPNCDMPNFLRLYEELGVRPEEGVRRLRERYRLRLRELHPDHAGGTPGGDAQDLGWMTRCYREALAFEQRHGRLPGGAGARSGGSEPAAADGAFPLARRRLGRRGGPRRRVREVAEEGLWRWRWMLAATALALTVLAISQAR